MVGAIFALAVQLPIPQKWFVRGDFSTFAQFFCAPTPERRSDGAM
jgi:hypothetical protein